jgi:hypothetical protein
MTAVRSVLPCLAVALVLASVQSGAAGAQQTAADTTHPWGEVTDGLQLAIAAGSNTESIARTQLLYLSVGWRNVSSAAKIADILKTDNTFDFEYEIDGIWYAFDRGEPVPTSLSRMLAGFRSSGVGGEPGTIAVGAVTSTSLNVPLAGEQINFVHGCGASVLLPGASFGPGSRIHWNGLLPGRFGIQLYRFGRHQR